MARKMNVFILSTGRCGTATFIKACRHISNFSSKHESRTSLLGEDHFDYPENHIEADNRLSWLLGRLDKHYGNNAVYVHLQRNNQDTARSYVKRFAFAENILRAYRTSILLWLPKNISLMSVSLDYCDTVNSNLNTCTCCLPCL